MQTRGVKTRPGKKTHSERRQIRAAGGIAFAALMFGMGAPAAAPAQRESNPSIPLRYIRRIAVAPAALTTAPDAPLPPRPPTPARRRLEQWLEQQRLRETLVRLREEARREISGTLAAKLSGLSGITVVAPPADSAPPVWQEPAERSGRSSPKPSEESMAAYVRTAQADAALVVAIDRFGLRSGLEREVWFQIVAYLMPAEGAARGPFFAVGRGRVTRRLIGRGYGKDDSQLVRESCQQIARQLTHTLETGRESPFMRSARVAILPAAAPDGVQRVTVGETDVVRVSLPSLLRQADVFLQPELPPVAEALEIGEVRAAMRTLKLQPRDLWSEGQPNREQIARVAQHLRADYLFLSRITALDLTQSVVPVMTAGQAQEGLERRAEAVLLRCEDGAILWRDRLVGTAAARTEYVRRKPRILTEEQTTVDAVRVAYAYLRLSFEEYKRRFER